MAPSPLMSESHFAGSDNNIRRQRAPGDRNFWLMPMTIRFHSCLAELKRMASAKSGIDYAYSTFPGLTQQALPGKPREKSFYFPSCRFNHTKYEIEARKSQDQAR
jgi:hypothetical protein